jgi:hypothetical protein
MEQGGFLAVLPSGGVLPRNPRLVVNEMGKGTEITAEWQESQNGNFSEGIAACTMKRTYYKLCSGMDEI